MQDNLEKNIDIVVIKRDGKRVNFDGSKIALAIKKGFDNVNKPDDFENIDEKVYSEKDIQKVFQSVIKRIEKEYENADKIKIEEIQDMIDEILMYPRIIVPIILIVTGIYNFAKAAFANKEDEMKKYQKKFFKQLLIGVMVFFIPTLINIIIDLSQYVWDGLKTCSI